MCLDFLAEGEHCAALKAAGSLFEQWYKLCNIMEPVGFNHKFQ